MNNENWYVHSQDEVIAFWRSSQQDGLSSKEAKNRLEKFGFNEIAEQAKTPWWRVFLAQFQDFMVMVLFGATFIAGVLGEYVDAITILAIVFLNAVLGFVQERRAERSLEALKKISAPMAKIVRNGMAQQIAAREIVPGDILLLEAGDKIPADGRLLETYNLEVEEAALTGESLPVRKIADRQFNEKTMLADRKNMIYAATIVTRGRGKAVVCSSGMATEVGRIAGMIQETKEEATPLERRLEHLGRRLVLGCILVCLLVVVVGIFKGESLFLMCMTGISLAVAAIPEGLPAIVTVSLALGVQRMIKKRAIVRKLPAVETLGCTTAICSDKTGTLTQNVMTVRQLYAGGKMADVSGSGYDLQGSFILRDEEGKPFDITKNKAFLQCLTVGVMCNNSLLKHNNITISGMWREKKESAFSIEGDPTEGAIVVAAAKAGLWRQQFEKKQKRVAEIPFESERRRMSVAYSGQNGEHVLYVKGAPDTILEMCKYYYANEGGMMLGEKELAAIKSVIENMSMQALRVLAVAYKEISKAEAEDLNSNPEIEKNLIFAGLIGMIDPPRQEAKAAIAVCRQAGIKTIMITGDHKNTAVAIAQELDIYNEGRDKALTGGEIDALSDKEFIKKVNDITVYARVSPMHKLRIVRALKNRGHIVAMTGDGVNDAPAVKEADIGIAMGKSGTEVTKEASDMVLSDDNFATIAAAIDEGRGIYNNIRKFIRYLLSCNIGEVLTMFLAALFGLPIPLLPLQILWVNLVTDGLPAMALGVDPKDPDIMRRPPRHPRESVFSRGLSRKIISKGIQIGFNTLFVFFMLYYLKEDLALARTGAFATLVFSQLFHVFECRSETRTIFELKFSSNKFLLLAVGFSLTMQLSVLYIPFFNAVFSTVPLSLFELAAVILISGATFIFTGFKHAFTRRRSPGKMPFPAQSR